MQLQRRIFLSGAVAISALLAVPRALLAAYPAKAFEQKDPGDALKSLFGSAEHSPSDKITLTAPDIAENGAVVPISVATTIEGATAISVIVEQNPQPLVASFDLTPGTAADVSTRIKMGKTSNVIAVVQADGKLYSTSKEVKVTIGGCGG
jgi:sulfur-oxidizing protein SoxY